MKKVLLAFLSVFFLVGGVVFSACTNESPQAVINLSSSDFASEDYIEIDLGSDRPYAQITASVENVSSGIVAANTSSQSILTTSTSYNSETNTTLITITGQSEGSGLVELRSMEGSGSRTISVYVYSDIVGLSQKDPEANNDQFVLRGQSNTLSSSRYLEITSRPNGESNRQDVAWSFAEEQSQLGLSLTGNVLTVGEDYVGEQINLVASSVYTTLSTPVTLDVIDSFTAPTLTFSRDANLGYDDYSGTPFTLIKNDATKEDAELFVKLNFTGLDQSELSTSWQVSSNGQPVDALDVLIQGSDLSGNPYYLIRAKSPNVNIQTLTIKFTVSYNKVAYSQTTQNFEVELADAVDRITVTSDGELVASDSSFDIYNNYSSDMPNGRPFQVVLGPNTVEGATFLITSSQNLGELFTVRYQVPGESLEPVEFTLSDGSYQSDEIPNNATVYFEALDAGSDPVDVTFVSTQSSAVSLTFTLTKREAPNNNFNITGNTNLYISTLTESTDSSVLSFAYADTPLNVADIFDGLYVEEFENFDVSLRLDGGKVILDVSNLQTNITESIEIKIFHRSGFSSTNSIKVTAFTPLESAAISYLGSNSAVVVDRQNANQTDSGETDFSLSSLTMRSSNSVTLGISTNTGATARGDLYSFAFYSFAEGYEVTDADKVLSDYHDIAEHENLELNTAAVTFDSTTGRLTVNSDIQGYVVFTFSGYNYSHSIQDIHRWFFLEGYTAPTSLRSTPNSLSLVARDSISLNDFSLSQASLRVTYRLDTTPITYFDLSKFSFRSTVNNALVPILVDEVPADAEYYITNLSASATELTFDLIANTTNGLQVFNDTLVVSYADFATDYFTSINISITSATRVESVRWENQTLDGSIYLDLYGQAQTDRQFTIVTTTDPLDAYNDDLTYIFEANSGTSANLVQISELGVVTFASGATVGGTGTIYVLPTDAIRSIGGIDYIVYFDSEGARQQIRLSSLHTNYETICSGYFLGSDSEQVEYRDVIVRIPVTVADGRSEETATRIYTAEQFENIDPNLHYVLMQSIELEDYDNADKNLVGTVKGYDKNVSIHLTGEPLFASIAASGKVESLTIFGEVTGGGFVANTNNGSISNITITTINAGSGVSMSTVSVGYADETGSTFAGAIVGINNGSLVSETGEIRVEGVKVDLSAADATTTTTYAGTFAGKNTGSITHTYGEFYLFADETPGDGGELNTISANYVGGFVGYADGGSVTHSYVYNYSAKWDDTGATPTLTFSKDALTFVEKTGAEGELLSGSGAFVGYVESDPTVSNSFSMLGFFSTIGYGSLGSSTNYYYAFGNSTTSVPALGDMSPEYWIFAEDEGFQDYVRGGQPHLRFYQAQTLTNLSGIKVQQTSISLPVSEGSRGILFFHRLQNTGNLSQASANALAQLNTISFEELFGNPNIVVSTSASQIVDISGNNIIIRGTGDVTLTVSSRHDYTQTQPFAFKVIYVLEDFTARYNGVITSGFDLQEGKSAYIEFSVKNSVYLAGEPQPRQIYLPDISLEGKITPTGLTKANYTISGMIGQISLSQGISSELEGKRETALTLNTTIQVNDFGADDTAYQTAIASQFASTMLVRPFQGSNAILTNVDSVRIEPAVTSKIEVTLVTDSESDTLILQLQNSDNQLLTFDDLKTESIAETSTTFVINAPSKSATASFATEILYISVARETFATDRYTYTITMHVDKGYRSQIAHDEHYTLILSSGSGTSENEGREVGITLSSQQINYVDIANYRASNVSNNNGQIIYSRTEEQVSVISPGRASFMSIVVDPTYAYYDHMTLTYQALDAVSLSPSNGVLTMTKLADYRSTGTQYTVDVGSATAIVGGVRVSRDTSGVYNFRLYASQNISQDTIFVISATFYDANNQPIGEPVTYQLYVTYLPEAEIMVDGQVSTILAKGGMAKLSIRLQQDQDIDYLTAVGATGITIAPRSAWVTTPNPDGTKTLTARLYASLNAGIVSGGNTVNGTFEVQASVVRVLNGVQERKNSNAYVTIVDIEPVSAQLDGATYDESSNTYVFTSWVGITNLLRFNYTFDPQTYSYDESNEIDSARVAKLNEIRAQFQRDGYYNYDTSGFSINYQNSQAIPIYQRLEMNGTRLAFTQTSDGAFTYSNGRFRLTYTEGEGLTVTGIGTTATPIYLTLVDEIRIASEGSDALYQIETNFAIGVSIYSDLDRPLIIQTAEDFLQVAEEGQAQDYILLNDITLQNYTPISSDNFRSLDGNGYSINIESFNLQGSGTLQLGLFTTIASGSTIKNLRVNYYQTPITVDVTSSGYSTISIAGLAVTNNGTVTNCQVTSYNPNGDDAAGTGFHVNFVRGSSFADIDANSSISSRVAGFVVENTGSITNSKVGGEDIILIGEQVASSNYFNYSVRELSLFELSAQGSVAGFVVSNSGQIASSGVSNIQITNLSSSDTSQTAGFVVSNSGQIRASAVQGVLGENDTGYEAFHRTGSSISARGIVAGFVVQNSQNGQISDGYSNILISNSSTTNSVVGAGFVYQNSGFIETSYSASAVEANNAHQLSFSGYDSVGNPLNTGTIQLSYYYISDQGTDSSSDVQAALNDANLINKDEVNNQNAYYGFVFNTDSDTDDGVWRIVDGYGVEPISLTKRTISHRYYVASETEEEYFLPYSTLQNQDDSLATVYNTAYGEEINPILINSAQDLKEAMGDSTSTSLSAQFTATEILGSYRFTTDIDLSELNNALGNAEIQSVNKTFKGTIDGNGFTISNISLSSSNTTTVGLFGSADGALIQNLNLEIDSVAAGSTVMVGGLVGYAKDSRILNIQMTQQEVTDQTEQRGIYGRNVTGGIVGAAIGDGALVGLSVSGAIVQSGYYNSNTTVSSTALYTHVTSAGDWIFNPATVRTYALQNDSRLYSSLASESGLGLASFAGAIAGYVDLYDSALSTQTSYSYSSSLTNEDYQVAHISVTGSLDVRGEVVGGAIGYTGVQTKVQDAAVYVDRGENITAKILSYNFIAGGLVGIANGDFYQVLTQHEETLQAEIERSMSNYYINGNTNAERGILDLFENTSATEAYQPQYVGGLFGVFGNGFVYVAYSKLNAINPNTSTNGYAGGLAGGAFSVEGSDFSVEDTASGATIQSTLLLQEVYVTGDVYANGTNTGGVASNFGGLFGRFVPYGSTGTSQSSQVRLTLKAVNAFNEFGILGEAYNTASAGAQAISTISAVVGERNGVEPVVCQVLSGIEGATDDKSFGYMASYTSGAHTVRVKSDIYSDRDQQTDALYVFNVQSLTTFANPESGYAVTNGAFINSNAWSIENWTHETTELFPTINLTSSPSYLYLDQDNIAYVLSQMSNSSIEVRVRGRSVDSNGTVSYGYVDLSNYLGGEDNALNIINSFSGRLIGATDNTWFNESTGGTIPWEEGDVTSDDALGSNYPGIVINQSLFSSVTTGVSFQNLNIVFYGGTNTANGSSTDAGSEIDNRGDSATVSYPFIQNPINNVNFINVRTWYVDPVSITVDDSGNAGLLAPSAENSNFINITMYFSKISNIGSNAVVQFKDNAEIDDDVDVSVGLLVGELVQSSSFETLRLQNITIKHPNLAPGADFMQVTTSGSANLYAGLYIGNLTNPTSSGESAGSDVRPTGVNISARLPESQTESITGDVFLSKVNVTPSVSTFSNIYVGGLFGQISAASVSMAFEKTEAYNQQLDVNVNAGVKTEEDDAEEEPAEGEAITTSIGGLVGSFNGSFTTNVSTSGSYQPQLGFNISIGQKHNDLSAGMLFGEIATSSSVTITPSVQLKIVGSVSKSASTETVSTEITTANIGGIVGTNSGVLTMQNLDIAFETYASSAGDAVPTEKLSEEDFAFGEGVADDDAFSAGSISAGALVGKNKAGTITVTGEVSADPNFKVNTAGENIRLSATATFLRAGGLIGETSGSGRVEVSGNINNTAVIWALGNVDSGSTTTTTTRSTSIPTKVSVGGVLGYSAAYGTEKATTLSITGTASDVNVFVSATNLTAGGIVGELTTTNNTDSTKPSADITNTITNNVFSGAFKVFGGTSNAGDHKIGGVVGTIGDTTASESETSTRITANIFANKTYGDAIYTPSNDFNSLSAYYFGGVVGQVGAGAAVTIRSNIVAFTNNNQLRGTTHYANNNQLRGTTHYANAMVGNATGTVNYDDTDDVTTKNYYSSQLVLATSDNAVDLNYKNTGESYLAGYSPNDEAEYTAGNDYNTTNESDMIKTIIGKLTSTVTGTPAVLEGASGTKLNPESVGTNSTNSTNGITYYTSVDSSETTSKITFSNTAFAFIGDWKEQTVPIDSLSVHSFISGVRTEISAPDAGSSQDVTTDDTNRGGIVNTMTGGIVYASISSGTLSVGGTVRANIGGIVGKITSGYINECSSSLKIVYRATSAGIASGIATTASAATGDFNKIFINNTYSSGTVTSYIDASLYSFTNGVANTSIFDSYTISRVSWKDYTSNKTKPADAVSIGITGNAVTTNFGYDPDAMGDAYEEGTERIKDPDNSTHTTSSFGENSNWIYPAYYDTTGNSVGTITISGWSKSADENYGYPVRNFGAFKAFKTQETETIDNTSITYELIPNVTKLEQAKTTNKNYKLVNDIDFAKTTYTTNTSGEIVAASGASKWSSLDFTNVPNFDGGEHTISNLRGATLFNTVQNISNLRVTDADLENQRAVVALTVTGSATNVIASGFLKGSSFGEINNAFIGGLFAEVNAGSDSTTQTNITNCKNYVKMDITQNGVDIGGVVGKAFGSNITGCFNYAPINVVNKNDGSKGGYVAGIVGSWQVSSSATIKECGNESTVFNGYVDTVNSDGEIGNGQYYAAGIVGWTNASSSNSITDCYNTSMIKAGNKGINAAKDSGAAYAAGIIANGSSTVSECTNTGFIEALGDTSKLSEPISTEFRIALPDKVYRYAGEPLSYTLPNLTGAEGQQGIAYKINAQDIKNVYASAIGLNSSDEEVSSGSSNNEGTVYRNGLFGAVEGSVAQTSGSNGAQAPYVPTYEPGVGNNETISLHNGDIKIYFAEETSRPTPVIAETDELGAMTKFYIKSTRTIKYNNDANLTRTQTRYWQVVDINGLHNGGGYNSDTGNYYAQKAHHGTSNMTYGSTAGSSLFIQSNTSSDTSSEPGDLKTVSIGGVDFAFVSTAAAFKAVAQSGMYQASIGLSDVEIGGIKFTALQAAGYTFTFTAYNSSNGIISGLTSSLNGTTLTFMGYGSELEGTTIASVSISAEKAGSAPQTVILQQGNIDLINNNTTITISGVNASLVNEKKYDLFLNSGTDNAETLTGYAWNSASSTLTKTSESSLESEYEKLKNADTVELNASQGTIIAAESTFTDSLISNGDPYTVKGSVSEVKGGTADDVTKINLTPSLYTQDVEMTLNGTLIGAVDSYNLNDTDITINAVARVKSSNLASIEVLSSFAKNVDGSYESTTTTITDFDNTITFDSTGGVKFVYNFSRQENMIKVDITATQRGEDNSAIGGLVVTALIVTANYNVTTPQFENPTIAGLPGNVTPQYSKNGDIVTNSMNQTVSGANNYYYNTYTQNYSLDSVEITNNSGDAFELWYIDGTETFVYGSHTHEASTDGSGVTSDVTLVERNPSEAINIDLGEIPVTGKTIIGSSEDSTLTFKVNGSEISITLDTNGGITTESSNVTILSNSLILVDGQPFLLDTSGTNPTLTYTIAPVLMTHAPVFVGSSSSTDQIGVTVGENTYSFTIGSTQYKITIGENGTVSSDPSIDTNWFLDFNIIKVDSQYYLMMETATGSLILVKCFVGSEGKITLGDSTYTYVLNSNDTITGYTFYNSDGSQASVSDSGVLGTYTYYSDVISERLLEYTYSSGSNITVNIPSDLSDGAALNSTVQISYNREQQSPVNLTLSGDSTYTVTIDNAMSAYVSGVAVTGPDREVFNVTEPDDSTTGSETTYTFSAEQGSGEYSYVINYKEYTHTISSLGERFDSDGGENSSTIVVTKDLDFGKTPEIQMNSSVSRITSTNNNIVNFRVQGANNDASDSLFAETCTAAFKNIAFAGSVDMFYNGTGHFGLLGKTLTGNLTNVSTYGTIYQKTYMNDAKNLAGGVAYKVQGDLTNVKSFVSLSHDTSNISRGGNNGYGNMAGIAWEFSKRNSESGDLNINAEYYGVIIGTNGSHGTSYNTGGTSINGSDGQNVYALAYSVSDANFTNSLVAGIIKAGDGGSGARGLDGQGGDDSTNGSAPYNGTYGDSNTAGTDADGKPIYFGGDKGNQGHVYRFATTGIDNDEDDGVTNLSKVIESSDGKQGSRGNDGWGGVNLYVYSANRDVDNKGISGGYEEETFGTFNVYNNGKCVDAENPNQVTNYYTVYSKFEIGRNVSDDRADKLNVITKNNDEGSTWYEIYFSKNNTPGIEWYENSTSIINNENNFYARLFTSGSINATNALVTWYQINNISVKIYVLPYPSNATSFSGANCFGL